jgi:hypothetical protein
MNTSKKIQTAPKYIIAQTWGHIFEGFGEKYVRFVFNKEENKIVFMDVMRGAWKAATPAQIADVQDSLINANEEAIQSPSNWGLSVSDSLPEWAI